VSHLELVVGQVLLICVTDENLHKFTYVKLIISECCSLEWLFIQVFYKCFSQFHFNSSNESTEAAVFKFFDVCFDTFQ